MEAWVQLLASGEMESKLPQMPAEDELDAERQQVKEALIGLAGERGLHVGCVRCLSKWRKCAQQHWLIPVWFLAVAEKFDDRALLARLRPDGDEADDLMRLAGMMRECGNCVLT